MRTALRIKLFLCLICFLLPFGLFASQGSLSTTPIEPAIVKVSSPKKTKRVKPRENYRLPRERLWGVWSLATGGYLIFFAIFSALFFIGFYYYLYLLAILVVLLVFGIYLSINGVSVIDRSYIHYSDHPELKADRVRPTIIRDFIFAGLLSFAILGFVLIQFYLSAWLCLIAVLAMITIAAMKLSALKNNERG